METKIDDSIKLRNIIPVLSEWDKIVADKNSTVLLKCTKLHKGILRLRLRIKEEGYRYEGKIFSKNDIVPRNNVVLISDNWELC